MEEIEDALARGVPPMGIGDGTIIDGAIIDKNACVGRNVRIENKRGDRERDGDGGRYVIRDGVVIIPKGAVIPDGTII
jgi:glucose-1-phosphate adenylyltransferase